MPPPAHSAGGAFPAWIDGRQRDTGISLQRPRADNRERTLMVVGQNGWTLTRLMRVGLQFGALWKWTNACPTRVCSGVGESSVTVRTQVGLLI